MDMDPNKNQKAENKENDSAKQTSNFQNDSEGFPLEPTFEIKTTLIINDRELDGIKFDAEKDIRTPKMTVKNGLKSVSSANKNPITSSSQPELRTSKRKPPKPSNTKKSENLSEIEDSTRANRKLSFASHIWSEMIGGGVDSYDSNTIPWWATRQAYITNFFDVPLKLEKLLFYGLFICFDSFLFIFTFLPLRSLFAIIYWICSLIMPKKFPSLNASQRFDLARISIFILSFFVLNSLDGSYLYHFIRGQASLKLYVIFNLIEIFDKLCCSFGQDIFDFLFTTILPQQFRAKTKALANQIPSTPSNTKNHNGNYQNTTGAQNNSNSNLNSNQISPSSSSSSGNNTSSKNNSDGMKYDDKSNSKYFAEYSSSAKVRFAKSVGAYFAALCYTSLHSLLLFIKVVTLNVSVNAYNNSLLTLLISNNFVELKGIVFKSFKQENVFQIACNDTVERFQIFAFLAIVCVHNLNDLSWKLTQDTIYNVLYIISVVVTMEVLVDWLKHAFITRFNRMQSSVYRDFSRIIALGVIQKDDVPDACYTTSKRIGFVALPLACVVFRVFIGVAPVSGLFGILWILALWATLVVSKVLTSLIILSMSISIVGRRTPSVALTSEKLAQTYAYDKIE